MEPKHCLRRWTKRLLDGSGPLSAVGQKRCYSVPVLSPPLLFDPDELAEPSKRENRETSLKVIQCKASVGFFSI